MISFEPFWLEPFWSLPSFLPLSFYCFYNLNKFFPSFSPNTKLVNPKLIKYLYLPVISATFLTVRSWLKVNFWNNFSRQPFNFNFPKKPWAIKALINFMHLIFNTFLWCMISWIIFICYIIIIMIIFRSLTSNAE